jgi:hypothetical protein
VVALPGDTVEVKKGKVLVEGKPLESEALPPLELSRMQPGDPTAKRFRAAWETAGTHRYRVIEDVWAQPQGDRPAEKIDGFFLLADRRTLVRDSRDFGPIPRRDLRSIALRVITAGDGDGPRQGKLP